MSVDVNVYFIIPDSYENEFDCTVEMHGAFELCKQYVTNSSWVRESDHETIPRNRQSIAIFEEFQGEVFKKLAEDKCLRVLGPRCLTICLMEKRPIPNCPTPVYIIPMVDMIVCCSGIAVSEKKRIQEKIGYMGGIYTGAFVKQTTHLISSCVNSEKYARAVELKLPVMLSSWVDAVWDDNLTQNVQAQSPTYDQHKCPPFYKLQVTSTGLTRSERDTVNKLITAHGGIYSGKFQSELTAVLICHLGSTSEKFEAAKKNKIECCTVEWVQDSVKSGYALPFDKYRVGKSCASSTFINQNDTRVDPNFSMASTIQGDPDSPRVKDLSETRFNFTNLSSVFAIKDNMLCKEPATPKVNTAIEAIDLKSVKKAGPFLDGCGVFLAGFESEFRDKLCKVLNLGSATRYDVISERVTHVIVGEPSSIDMEEFHKQGHHPIAVSVDWLIESIRLKHPASEESFKISLPKSPMVPTNCGPPSSPLSTKGVQMLRTNSSINIPKFDLEDSSDSKVPEEPEDLINEYMQNNDQADTLEQFLAAGSFNSHPPESIVEPVQAQAPPAAQESTLIQEESVDITSGDPDLDNLFQGITFAIIGWDDNSLEQVTDMIVSSSGTIVTDNDQSVPDYTVVPQDGLSTEVVASKIVTIFWLEDCLTNVEVLPISYYHKPVLIPLSSAPLAGCIITISTYKGYERSFMNWLIEHLGATFEEILSRKENKKGIPATTHLICPSSMGTKYSAAVKWGIPVVTHEWLLDCAAQARKLPEKDYSVNTMAENSPSTSKVSLPSTKKNNHANAAVQLAKNNTPMKTPVSAVKKRSSEDLSVDKENFATPHSSPIRQSQETEATESDIIGNKNNLPNIDDPTDSNGTPQPTSQNTPTNKFLEKIGLPQGGDSSGSNTPVSTLSSNHKTPKHQGFRFRSSIGGTPVLSQQMTPVAKFLENLGLPKTGYSTPDNSPLPATPTHVDTPNTPLGRCFGDPNPSPNTRKYWAKRINALPSYHHTPPPKRQRLNSTPLSELKERLWKKILPKNFYEEQGELNTESVEEETQNTPVSNPVVTAQVQQLKEMMERRASEGGRKSIHRTITAPSDISDDPRPRQRPVIESQPDTIGWDDDEEVEIPKDATSQIKRFMLSQIASSERLRYVEIIDALGGHITEQPTLFDESCTHLVCTTPARNEKLLASVAAGKWVLHDSYLIDSEKAGHFLEEELYEFGNPKASNLGVNTPIALSIYRWRTQIAMTGERAYHGMRALILMTSRKEQIARLVEAGGGQVVDAEPPYRVDVTHCFIDPKTLDDYPESRTLASRGVYCLQPIFLNNLLMSDPPPDPTQCIIPALQAYYKESN